VVWGNTFDWLDGTVRVPVPMPTAWAEGLGDFYQAPNDDRWGGSLCRILYHESIHFWQLLSSAYLANLVQEEWLRFADYMRNGMLRPAHPDVIGMRRVEGGRPFSPLELIECWARYWDVHTRHPRRILEEDGLEPPPAWVADAIGAPPGAYTSAEFDTFMQHGRDAATYARPYRWMLDRAEGDSSFVNIAFPVVVFCAFGSPWPVQLFIAAFERAQLSREVRAAVDQRTGSINVDWLYTYRAVIEHAVAPAVCELGGPVFTAGWDVLDRGPLGTHPIYGTYRSRVQIAMRSTRKFNTDQPADDSVEELLRSTTARAALSDPLVMFMFPGQPTYRMHLGRTVPPPRVQFVDATWHAEREFAAHALHKLALHIGADVEDGNETLAPTYAQLDRDIQRFRGAEYAVRRGLPADTFTAQAT
jgi:hypothetical protein